MNDPHVQFNDKIKDISKLIICLWLETAECTGMNSGRGVCVCVGACICVYVYVCVRVRVSCSDTTFGDWVMFTQATPHLTYTPPPLTSPNPAANTFLSLPCHHKAVAEIPRPLPLSALNIFYWRDGHYLPYPSTLSSSSSSLCHRKLCLHFFPVHPAANCPCVCVCLCVCVCVRARAVLWLSIPLWAFVWCCIYLCAWGVCICGSECVCGCLKLGLPLFALCMSVCVL